MYSRTFFEINFEKKEKAKLSQRRYRIDRHTRVEPTKGFLHNTKEYVYILNFLNNIFSPHLPHTAKITLNHY